MPEYLRLHLEGPLCAYGGEAVDSFGVIADFPAASMLTGLIANALGWERHHREALARLQARLHYAARIDHEGTRITDFQTAKLGAGDRGWTTRGAPEGRAGGAATYNSPHIRRRAYDADKTVLIALCLDQPEQAPTLAEIAAALDEPARPLFLGRKPCLPTARLNAGIVEAEGLCAALASLPPPPGSRPRVLLPETEAPQPGDETKSWSDQRNWRSGVHGGTRQIIIRRLPTQNPATP